MENNLDILIKNALKDVADSIELSDSDKLKECIDREIAHDSVKGSTTRKNHIFKR